MNREQKVHEIVSALSKIIEAGDFKNSSLGLFSGKFGILLFLSHYFDRHKDSEHMPALEKFQDECFDDLVNKPVIHSYCNGFAGILQVLRHLKATGLMDADYSEIEEAYENFLYNSMITEFQNNHYDMMHGALSITVSYADNPRFVLPALEWLEKNKTEENGCYKWRSFVKWQEQIQGYNIALSHGMSSILILLCQIHKAGLERARVKDLIKGCRNYILSQRIDFDKYGCFFPIQSLENGDPIIKSRLAWCYGDLGVLAALWQVAGVLKDDKLKAEVLDMIAATADRTGVADNSINDACLCHGSAGVAMMFDYFYSETGNDELRKTRDYWLDVTLKIATFPDGLAGYKTFHPDEKTHEPGWTNATELLEGVSGVGLMLMAADDGKNAGHEPARNPLFDFFWLYQ